MLINLSLGFVLCSVCGIYAVYSIVAGILFLVVIQLQYFINLVFSPRCGGITQK